MMSDLNDATGIDIQYHTARMRLLSAATGFLASELYIDSQTTDGANDDAEMELKEEMLVKAARVFVDASNRLENQL